MEGIIGPRTSNKEYEIFPQLSSLSLRDYRKSPSAIFDLWMSCPQGSTSGRFCLVGNINDSCTQVYFRPLDVLPKKGPLEVASA